MSGDLLARNVKLARENSTRAVMVEIVQSEEVVFAVLDSLLSI